MVKSPLPNSGFDIGCVLPHAGLPLDDKHLLPEISILFMAGFESALPCLWIYYSPHCLMCHSLLLGLRSCMGDCFPEMTSTSAA